MGEPIVCSYGREEVEAHEPLLPICDEPAAFQVLGRGAVPDGARNVCGAHVAAMLHVRPLEPGEPQEWLIVALEQHVDRVRADAPAQPDEEDAEPA